MLFSDLAPLAVVPTRPPDTSGVAPPVGGGLDDDAPPGSERLALQPRTQHDSVLRNVSILIAEDNPADALLVRLALEEHGVAGDLTVVGDGESAISFLQRIDAGELPRPDLLILDLNLPKKSGHEVLHHLRQVNNFREMPVVILSSSTASRDFSQASLAGVRHYLRKPANLDAFLQLGAVFRATLSSGL